MSLPRKIMEQCRLCPAKLWSNADFGLQNHRPFVLCPAKSQRLRSLPHKIMEQCRLCSTKSRKHTFRGQQISSNLNFFLFFSIYFCKSLLFQRSLQPFGPLFKEKIFCVMVPLREIDRCRRWSAGNRNYCLAPCLGLCFFSELKFLDYSRTNFHLFAGVRVLDTH